MYCENTFQSGIYTKPAKATISKAPSSGYNASYLKTTNTKPVPQYPTAPPPMWDNFSQDYNQPVAEELVQVIPTEGYNSTYLKTLNTNPIPKYPTYSIAKAKLEMAKFGVPSQVVPATVDIVALINGIIASIKPSQQAKWRRMKELAIIDPEDQEVADALAELSDGAVENAMRIARATQSQPQPNEPNPIEPNPIEPNPIEPNKPDEKKKTLTNPANLMNPANLTNLNLPNQVGKKKSRSEVGFGIQ